MARRKQKVRKGRSFVVPEGQIEALEKIRSVKRWSYLRLWIWMHPPFSHETLRNALNGFPVWKPHYEFIVQFVPTEQPEGNGVQQ